MNKRQQKEAIEQMHTKLGYDLGLCEEQLWDLLGDHAKASERAHRKLAPAGCGRPSITVSQAVKYFRCKWILEGLVRNEAPVSWYEVAETRADAIYGFALAETYHSVLLAEIGLENAKAWLDSVDYAELMR